MFTETHDLVLLALAALYLLTFIGRLVYKTKYPMVAAFIAIALVVTAVLW